MITTYDDRFTEHRQSGGVIFQSPSRRWPTERKFGAGVFAVGLVLGAAMMVWLSTPFIAWLANRGGIPWQAAPFLLLALLAIRGLRWAYRLVATGWTLIRGQSRCQIEISGGEIRCVERMLGWGTNWHRRLPYEASQIQSLRIREARMDQSRTPTSKMDEWFGDHGSMLTAEAQGQKPFNLAIAFPEAVLVQLAQAMNAYLPDANVINDCSTLVRSRDDAVSTQRFELPVAIPDQPHDSNIALTNNPQRLTAQVPAAGLWRGAKGLLVFAMIWNGGVMASICGLAYATQQGILDVTFSLAASVVLFAFELIGIGTLVAALDMGLRKTGVAIAAGQLFVVRQHLWGKRTQTWEIENVDKICVGPSGTKVNDVPIQELQIHFDQGHVGLLSERSDDELDWLAAHLNQHIADSAAEMTDVT